MDQKQIVIQASDWLKSKLPQGFQPKVGVTLGTGLSGLASQIKPLAQVPYSDIPGFPISTVESHAGELILGELENKPVAALAGRFHLYEGYTPQQVTLPVRVLASLGVDTFVFSNAAGGLDPSMEPGRVMLIKDHINFTGANPLIGDNVDEWGERFPDMSQVYDTALLDIARNAAADMGIKMYEGVYVGLKGPSMETPGRDPHAANPGCPGGGHVHGVGGDRRTAPRPQGAGLFGHQQREPSRCHGARTH
jgi:purine-nucleoside phosphorylase